MGCLQSSESKANEGARKRSSLFDRVPNNKGVSVYHLKTTFLKNVKDAGFNERSTIYDLENLESPENGFIRQQGESMKDPVDGRLGASYVDSLSGEDNVGTASVMLSYTWGYTIGDIIDSLDDFCKVKNRDAKRTYIWMCCLCINQHRVVEEGKIVKDDEKCFEVFQKIFHSRVTSIGEVVSMMYPW